MADTHTAELGVLEVAAPRPFTDIDTEDGVVYTFSAPAGKPPRWVFEVVERRRTHAGS
jgi:hypothetical protein